MDQFLKINNIYRGGNSNRFGSVLSGNPNQRYLFGSPSGGAHTKPNKNRAPEKINGPYRYTYGTGKQCGKGRMETFINPPTLHRTYPTIGSFVY